MNIAVGKLGKKFYFNRNKWTIDSGDSEVSSTIITLAALNPEMTFYIIGNSDCSELSESDYNKYFIHKNVIDVWKDFNKNEDRTTFVTRWFKNKNITIDFGYIHIGPTSQVNIPDMSYQLKSGEIAKVINMSKLYCGPIVHFLNDSKIPYVVLGEDPRYFPIPARDLFNRPKEYYSTYNASLETKYADGYLSRNIIHTTEKLTHKSYDRMFLVSEDFNKINDYKKYTKDILLDVYTNGNSGAGEKKYKIMKEYLKDLPDAKCYGKWSEDLLQPSDSAKFLNIPMNEMTEQLYKTKYTLMFHFEEGYPSSKFWKMIYFGILPFYHPNMDLQKNQPVHEWLRVKSQKEFMEKINYLENNKDFYKELLTYHTNLFKEAYFDGSFMNEVFHIALKDYINTTIKHTPLWPFYKETILFAESKVYEEIELKTTTDTTSIFDLM